MVRESAEGRITGCKKKSLKNCKANDESAWTALDQWQPDQ